MPVDAAPAGSVDAGRPDAAGQPDANTIASPTVIGTYTADLPPWTTVTDAAVAGSYLYFSTSGGAPALFRIPKDGGTIDVVIQPGFDLSVLQVAPNNIIYVRAGTGAGSSPFNLCSLPPGSSQLGCTLLDLSGMVVANGGVYGTAYASGANPPVVWHVDVSASGAFSNFRSVAFSDGGGVLSDAVAANAAGVFVCGDSGPYFAPFDLSGVVQKSGGAACDDVVLADGQMFWSSGKSLLTADAMGGPAAPVGYHPEQVYSPPSLHVLWSDGSAVFFWTSTTSGTNELMEYDPASGTARALATASDIGPLAIDATHVYWVTSDQVLEVAR